MPEPTPALGKSGFKLGCTQPHPTHAPLMQSVTIGGATVTVTANGVHFSGLSAFEAAQLGLAAEKVGNRTLRVYRNQ